ncbi:DUF3900 domain-containing protein [Brevibacillus dissolubilis]|uniref:DUF3900 domain-containing protein n=1 Tax=Brevibacillus dissolubilis TaxID=1844116 RepID=UPI0011172A09|nr:DUF3900 domain-containing protein [Brevibacillus dissolubilis]
MNFEVDWLAFYLIEQLSDDQSKQVRMSRYLSYHDYEKSELKYFLEGEFTKIAKRKAELNPATEGAPTKLGQFIVEPGHPLESNPNYAMFQKLLNATGKEEVFHNAMPLVQSYLKTPQVRGGVLLLVRAKLDKFDDKFLFILKCDFEQNTAIITDENSLISNVEMAINSKNMKSVMYPHLIEEGMVDAYHVKIHQFSHARYFEEFLKFIEYPQTITQLISDEVINLARQHIEYVYPEADSQERIRAEEEIELIAASPKRELTEKWEHETVMEAMQILTERQPEIELKFKLDHLQVRALLADYGSQLHIAKVNNRYVVVLEGDYLQFERGHSPIEFLKPKGLEELVKEIEERSLHDYYETLTTPAPAQPSAGYEQQPGRQDFVPQTVPDDDTPPW